MKPAALRALIALSLVALVVGGCILSSDDGAPPARTGWQPELWITPDSVSAYFPNDWPDTTLFTWNHYVHQGVPEYIMEAVVRLSTVRPLDAHFEFLRESDGSTPHSGTFLDMAMGARGVWWVTDAVTGVSTAPGYGHMEIHLLESGVLVRLTGWDAEVIDGFPPKVDQLWPVTFLRHGALFDKKSVSGSVHYRHDLAQRLARQVDGPLYPDDYVVLDLAIKAFASQGWPRPLVVTESIVVRRPFEDYAYAYLGLDNDTRAAFETATTKQWDLTALSQLGYEMVADNTPLTSGDLQIAASAVGYNHEKTEAVVYVTTYCGNLCAEGDLLVFDKINGYWRLKREELLWIS